MASIDVKTTYMLQLTADEFRLVGDALRQLGTAESLELNAQLQEIRTKHVRQMYERCEHISASARKEANGQ